MVPSAKGTKRARARLVGNARRGASHAASADETGTHAPTRVDGARPPYRPSSPSSRETNAKPAEGSNRGGFVTPFRNPEPYKEHRAAARAPPPARRRRASPASLSVSPPPRRRDPDATKRLRETFSNPKRRVYPCEARRTSRRSRTPNASARPRWRTRRAARASRRRTLASARTPARLTTKKRTVSFFPPRRRTPRLRRRRRGTPPPYAPNHAAGRRR